MADHSLLSTVVHSSLSERNECMADCCFGRAGRSILFAVQGLVTSLLTPFAPAVK